MIDYSLYLCTNSEMNVDYPLEYCVEQSILGGVTIVQIREKEKNYDEFFQIASRIKKVTDKYNIPLIINDNLDVAKISKQMEYILVKMIYLVWKQEKF